MRMQTLQACRDLYVLFFFFTKKLGSSRATWSVCTRTDTRLGVCQSLGVKRSVCTYPDAREVTPKAHATVRGFGERGAREASI